MCSISCVIGKIQLIKCLLYMNNNSKGDRSSLIINTSKIKLNFLDFRFSSHFWYGMFLDSVWYVQLNLFTLALGTQLYSCKIGFHVVRCTLFFFLFFIIWGIIFKLKVDSSLVQQIPITFSSPSPLPSFPPFPLLLYPLPLLFLFRREKVSKRRQSNRTKQNTIRKGEWPYVETKAIQ